MNRSVLVAAALLATLSVPSPIAAPAAQGFDGAGKVAAKGDPSPAPATDSYVAAPPSANAGARAEIGVLRGRVIDGGTRNVVSGAGVLVAGRGSRVVLTTDSEGKYEARLPAGQYSVGAAWEPPAKGAPEAAWSAATYHVIAVPAGGAIGVADIALAPEDKPKAKEQRDAELKAFYEAYRLKDGENLKLFLPPFLAGRSEYYRQSRGGSVPAGARDPRAYYFRWSDGKLVVVSAVVPENTYARLIVTPLGIGPADLDGDTRLLKRVVQADVIWRDTATADTLLKEMQGAFARQFVVPLGLSWREDQREVYVARGSYQYARLRNRSAAEFDAIEIDPAAQVEPAGATASDVEITVPNMGTLSDFLAWLRGYVGQPVVSEIADDAHISVMWYEAPRLSELTEGGMKPLPEPEFSAVLDRISIQTGLSFTREKRKIRRLLVELGES